MRITNTIVTTVLSVTLSASVCFQTLAAFQLDAEPGHLSAEEKAGVNTFESYDEIVGLVTQRSNNHRIYLTDAITEAATPNAGVQNDVSKAEITAFHSVTNTQILGIDEADTIKTDGEYLYTLSNNSIVVVKVSGSNMELASHIEMDSDVGIEEFYITDNRLIIIGTENTEYPLPVIPAKENEIDYHYRYIPETWDKASTVYCIYDISDKNNPNLLQQYTLSGTNMSTRLIGDKLYYAVEYTPVYSWLYNMFIEAGIDVSSEMIIPAFSENGDEFVPALDSIYYFSNSDSYSFMSLGVLDISGIDTLRPKVYFGNGDTFYMDYENIVISCGIWSYDSYLTYLYRFSVDEEGITYIANAKITGEVIDQYSLDVYNDNVRVAVSNRTDGNGVFVFNRNMELIGSTDKFAKGETVRSARFVGDMAYIVTFQTVDPLFCVDLSDPTGPMILGELKIPGFSQYLHPVGDGLLIGFGRDTEENDWGGFYDTGMKVSLFDISDPHNPLELDALRFDGNKYYSETFNNPKSLFVDPVQQRFGFSVICTEEIKFHPEINNSSDLERVYASLAPKIWYGLIFIDITNNELVNGGAIHHGRLTASHLRDLNRYVYNPFDQFTVRAVYIGDILYTAGSGKIQAHDYKTFELLNTLKVD